MILLSLKRSTSGNAAVKNPLALSATSFSSGGHVCYLGRVAQGVVHLLLEFENGEYNVKMNLKCFSLKQCFSLITRYALFIVVDLFMYLMDLQIVVYTVDSCVMCFCTMKRVLKSLV